MSEQIVQVADASPSTKNMRTIQQTAGGNTVQSEVVVLATGAANGGDTYDARQIRTLTTSDNVTAAQSSAPWTFNLVDGTDSTLKAQIIKNTDLNTTITRQLPVRLTAASSPYPTIGQVVVQSGTVTANQGTPNAGGSNAWPVAGGYNQGQAPGTNLLAVMDALDTSNNLTFHHLATGAGFGSLGMIVHPDSLDTYNISFNGTAQPVNASSTQSGTWTVNDLVTDPVTTSQQARVDNQGRLAVSQPIVQNAKSSWGPGWGNFTGW